MLNQEQIQHFRKFGYLVIKQAANSQTIESLRAITEQHLEQAIEPIELESDVHYPGAPESKDAPGGKTARRLLDAYHRDVLFKEWANKPSITKCIRQILQSKELYINPNHHNCVMTKHPKYSSQTNWHRDTRYWHFSDKYLVNAWLALGDEQKDNGGMQILPGSHRWEIESNALDEKQFLIESNKSNQSRLSIAEHVDLNAGDLLLFSAHCFHAAGKNHTNDMKLSLVFTYHDETTKPLPNTKSSKLAEIKIL